jgi:GNAT superfamily N-acetyltransferase
MPVTVRSAGSSDLPALLALYLQLNPDDPAIDEHTAAATWTTIAGIPGRTVLVAEQAAQILGTLEVTIVPNLTRGGRPVLLVENVVVDYAQRRRGLGRRLLEAAADIGREAGCYKLQLSTDVPEAFAFYESTDLNHTARTYKRYLDGD